MLQNYCDHSTMLNHDGWCKATRHCKNKVILVSSDINLYRSPFYKYLWFITSKPRNINIHKLWVVKPFYSVFYVTYMDCSVSTDNMTNIFTMYCPSPSKQNGFKNLCIIHQMVSNIFRLTGFCYHDIVIMGDLNFHSDLNVVIISRIL